MYVVVCVGVFQIKCGIYNFARQHFYSLCLSLLQIHLLYKVRYFLNQVS